MWQQRLVCVIELKKPFCFCSKLLLPTPIPSTKPTSATKSIPSTVTVPLQHENPTNPSVNAIAPGAAIKVVLSVRLYYVIATEN